MGKRKFILVVDVETANSTDDALVYDLGFAVCDKLGNVYEKHSLIISDIFYGESELMKTAYYAEKIPKYLEGIEKGEFEVVSLYTARKLVLDTMQRWNIKTVAAYNANFDISALNCTYRWITKSKYRYFFRYGTKYECIWSMACQVLYTQKSFVKFAFNNGYMSPSGNLQTSAEVGYRYLTGEKDFEESHTGLADVLIEAKIMARCLRQHRAMKRNINRLCWQIPQRVRKEMQKNGEI